MDNKCEVVSRILDLLQYREAGCGVLKCECSAAVLIKDGSGWCKICGRQYKAIESGIYGFDPENGDNEGNT